MKLWKILVIVALVVGGLLWWKPWRKTDLANFPPTATGDWIAFGDSLTSGFGASDGNDYPALLGKKVGRNILNAGVPGQTSDDAVQRVEEIVRLQPRVVLLCFGGNDGLRQLPPEKTFANLSAVIDRLQAGGSFVVLVGIRSASLSDRYAKPFKKLAKQKRVLFVPNILGGVLGSPNLMSDYIHPNDEGYKMIADRLEEILRPLLSNL